MKVTINGAAYECAAARKTDDAVFLYDKHGKEFAAFSGIRDLSTVTVEGGKWTESTPTQLDRVEAQVTYTALMTDTLLDYEEV